VAEQMILVCDVCGQPASETVTIRVGRRGLTKDLCERHLSEITAGARPVRRGRRRQVVTMAAKPSTRSAAPGTRRRGRPRATADATT
jgi:hypothetical protein